MNKLALAILNWNGKHHLELFLPSVVQHSNQYPIYIIDNASTDGSVSWVQNQYPEIHIIQNPTNLGYCEGYNAGLEHIEAEYFLLLNSDIEVTPNWLNPLIDCLDADKSIAACQPKIKSYSDKQAFEYAGACGGFIDKWGYPFCRGRIFDTVEKDVGQYQDSREIFWATGACLLIRSDLFASVGGFDSLFFAHMEEIDLCWRFKNKGYKIYVCPDSEVYHLGGGTLHKSNPYKTFLNFRNNLCLLYKNLPKEKCHTVLLVRLILDGLAGLRFLLAGEIRNCWAIVRAHIAFYRLVKKLNRQAGIATSVPISVVWQYFVAGIKKYSDLKQE